ncbi:MAG: hypothetical protein HYV09_16345 [Deltaproteobacteria bacterium]|nr:hypothetical protein [Deltaproteobacteria bacterium]
MARTTGPQKSDRILRFLVALRDDAVSAPLVAAGFGDDDLEEGWALLRRLSPPSVAGIEPEPVDPVGPAFERLEAWARRYIRLLEPAIERKHPALHAGLFGRLPALSGPTVVLAVDAFLDRVTELPKKRPNGLLARKLLARRGLTDDELTDARRLVRTVQGFPRERPGKPRTIPDYAAAEREAWAWYLEWSTVARAVISDGRVLRRLGFSARGKGADDGATAIGSNP